MYDDPFQNHYQRNVSHADLCQIESTDHVELNALHLKSFPIQIWIMPFQPLIQIPETVTDLRNTIPFGTLSYQDLDQAILKPGYTLSASQISKPNSMPKPKSMRKHNPNPRF